MKDIVAFMGTLVLIIIILAFVAFAGFEPPPADAKEFSVPDLDAMIAEKDQALAQTASQHKQAVDMSAALESEFIRLQGERRLLLGIRDKIKADEEEQRKKQEELIGLDASTQTPDEESEMPEAPAAQETEPAKEAA